ncbi:MAG: hemolysin family protein [Thermodesulfobacteriota bacterium]
MEQSHKPTSLIRRTLHRLGLDNSPDTAAELETEIQELIEEGEEQGLLSSQQGEMLSSIIDFRATSIKEIMTPSTEIIQASIDAEPSAIVQLIRQHGFSRIPIFEESPDKIKGFIHAKNLLTCPDDDNDLTPATLAPLLNPIIFTRGDDMVMNLLHDFQAKGIHLAIVTDEFGATRGLVTLEDILEEIVGDIVDETDKPDNLWQVVDADTLITAARVDIEEVEEFFGLKFPEGNYESIGGFILNQSGKIPPQGESIPFEELTLTVTAADPRHIITVKIERAKPQSPA